MSTTHALTHAITPPPLAEYLKADAFGHPRSSHTCGAGTGSADGVQATPRVRKSLDGTVRYIVDAILNARDVHKLLLGDTRKEEKHQTGWEPKAAQERAKSSVNSQYPGVAASKEEMCLPPCLPLIQK